MPTSDDGISSSPRRRDPRESRDRCDSSKEKSLKERIIRDRSRSERGSRDRSPRPRSPKVREDRDRTYERSPGGREARDREPRNRSMSPHPKRSRDHDGADGGQNSKSDGISERCIYISNLDRKCTNEMLEKICRSYGDLEYCFVVLQPKTESNRERVSRGYGFAKFQTAADARHAREKMTGQEVEGKRIHVEYSKNDNPRDPSQNRNRRHPSVVQRSKPDRRSSSSHSPRRRKKSDKIERRGRKYERNHSDSRSRSNSRRRQRRDN